MFDDSPCEFSSKVVDKKRGMQDLMRNSGYNEVPLKSDNTLTTSELKYQT